MPRLIIARDIRDTLHRDAFGGCPVLRHYGHRIAAQNTTAYISMKNRRVIGSGGWQLHLTLAHSQTRKSKARLHSKPKPCTNVLPKELVPAQSRRRNRHRCRDMEVNRPVIKGCSGFIGEIPPILLQTRRKYGLCARFNRRLGILDTGNTFLSA